MLIASYEARLLEAINAVQPDERRDAPVLAHPNSTKEKEIKSHGDQPVRTASGDSQAWT
ncbi:MAG TPA: hypothetical protein VMT47_16950 [Polyangia bacterium]|nr:hypothetical protein [Polyangia bacterium]